MRAAIDDSRYDVIGGFKDLSLEELYYGQQRNSSDEKLLKLNKQTTFCKNYVIFCKKT